MSLNAKYTHSFVLVWEDLAVWNADFLIVFPFMNADDLGDIEKKLLQLLEYRVSLQASVYTKYYFELRTISSSSPHVNNAQLQPLDRRAAEIIEARTTKKQEIVQAWKSKSVESFSSKPRMILS